MNLLNVVAKCIQESFRVIIIFVYHPCILYVQHTLSPHVHVIACYTAIPSIKSAAFPVHHSGQIWPKGLKVTSQLTIPQNQQFAQNEHGWLGSMEISFWVPNLGLFSGGAFAVRFQGPGLKTPNLLVLQLQQQWGILDLRPFKGWMAASLPKKLWRTKVFKSWIINSYCWWKKTGDHHLGCMKNPVNDGINCLSTGFLPSTVLDVTQGKLSYNSCTWIKAILEGFPY